jgi:ATP-binding cassette, subfamily B, bacterial
MYGRAHFGMMGSLRQDPSVSHQKVKPGTVRRIFGYSKPYILYLNILLMATLIF